MYDLQHENNVIKCNAQIQFKRYMTEKTYCKWKRYILVQMAKMNRVSELLIFLILFLHHCQVKLDNRLKGCEHL